MNRILIFIGALAVVWSALISGTRADQPNIVVIFADDMGIDCVSAFNERLGIRTPNIDRVATEGMSFMDAHTTSAVCSPSRYGLLTGRYNWRSRLKRGIVGTWERPLIEPGRLTLPAMLKRHRYNTAMIGKWHLGFDWPSKHPGPNGGVAHTETLIEIDFSGPIRNGPNGRGFDYWFGDDVPNWPPYAWRENDRMIGTISTTAKQLGITQWEGVSDGPAVADWKLESVLPEYARRCSELIRQYAEKPEPFFLYFSMPSPHTPIAPDEHWQGKSGISDYADFLLETDWAVGEILRTLDETQLAENTIVVFTSDNGTSPKANFKELASQGVHLSEHWRGCKADAFEGGHRVPLIFRWPGSIAPGTRCSEVVSLVDLMATFADIVSFELPDNAAEDSVSLLPILRGDQLRQPIHEAIICHSISGHFAVREGGQGRWKALFCRGSGGWSQPTEKLASQQDLPSIQLYDLHADPKESTNLHAQYPEVSKRLTAVLRRYIENGRSTPGEVQFNHDQSTRWGYVPW